MAAGDQPALESARLRVEARVEDRGVGLARAGADIVGFDQRDPQLEAGKLTGNGCADVAGTDDRDVVTRGPSADLRERDQLLSSCGGNS